MGPGPARDALLGARVRLVIRVMSVRLCRSPGFSRSDRPDVEHTLLLAMLRKAHLYDPSRGASPYTWACRVLDTERLMILRDRHRLKRAAGLRVESLETGSVVVHGRAVRVSDVVSSADRGRTRGDAGGGSAAAAEATEAVAHVVDRLPPELLKLAKLLMTGTPAAAARSLRISRRQLYADMAEIRRRFRGAGFGGKG
jgi:DNA-directed RNA polymerase specialized sigma24 family protein